LRLFDIFLRHVCSGSLRRNPNSFFVLSVRSEWLVDVAAELTVGPCFCEGHDVHLVVSVPLHAWHVRQHLVKVVNLFLNCRPTISADWSHLIYFFN